MNFMGDREQINTWRIYVFSNGSVKIKLNLSSLQFAN